MSKKFVHTINITVSLTTDKDGENLAEHIDDIEDELSGMFEQDLKDWAHIEGVTLTTKETT